MSQNLIDQVTSASAAGEDSTVAEVTCKAGFRLRIERVNSMAPMLQGMSALFVIAPAAAAAAGNAVGVKGKPPSIMGGKDAETVAGILHGLLMKSVTGTRGEEGEEWAPVRLVAQKAEENPDATPARIWIGRIPDPDQLRCYNALVKLHTGEDMATLIATTFQLAADKLTPALARFAVWLRSMDGSAVEPGADDVQLSGPDDGDEGGAESSPEGG